MTATRTGRRRRAGIAWLAVLALLINALVPASLAIAAGQGREAVSGWCGTAHGSPQPGNGAAAPFCDHCAVCAVAFGLEPPAATGTVAPTPIAISVGSLFTPIALPRLSAYRPSQPRGPPVASRI